MLDESTAFAKVKGQAWSATPKDLYIPPDALEVFLDSFEGPLDLLLYLIRKQNLDICDIAIHSVTLQYMQYVELMQEMKLELAADYLLMAAILAEIKSRSLLPVSAASNELQPEADPRLELLRRLQEYELVRQAALDLDQLPRVGRDLFVAAIQYQKTASPVWHQPEVGELAAALAELLQRAELLHSHQVSAESLSVRQKMSQILQRLEQQDFIEFHLLLDTEEGRLGVVVSFLAMMELLKEGLIDLVQTEAFSVMHLRSRLHG